MSKRIKFKDDSPLRNFMLQVYKILEEREIPICKFSKIVFGCDSEMSRLKSCRNEVSLYRCKKIAKALDMDLKITLEEKDV